MPNLSKRSDEEMVAYALEIDPLLLPHVPELLADFDELGSDAGQIIDALSALNLPRRCSIIDLGCGKGAIAVAIASELGFPVLGIDLFEPFIAECAARAKAEGVSSLCAFRHGNIVKLAGSVEPAHVVILAALGDVLGPPDQTIEIIRSYTLPGGFMLISDGYIRDGGSKDSPGFENYGFHAETMLALLSHGDRLILELPENNSYESGCDEAAAIFRRAMKLAVQYPELESALRKFAEDQDDEYEFLGRNFVSTTWVFQRSSDEVR